MDHPGHRRGRGRRRRAASLLTLAAAFGSLAVQASPGDGPLDLDETRAALGKWVETRRVLSQEKRDWAVGRELLQERIDLVQREIDASRRRIDETRGSLAEADAEALGLRAENERLQRATSSLADVVVTLEDRTRRLLARLPAPIVERVRPLSQQIPGPSDETKLSLSQRFQNVVGVLNEVDKFHREVTVTSEVRTFADGSAAEVTALYAGVSQGWYASVNGKVAGRGASGAGGWVWTSDDALAPDVLRAIAVVQDEEPADFVALPVDATEGE